MHVNLERKKMIKQIQKERLYNAIKNMPEFNTFTVLLSTLILATIDFVIVPDSGLVRKALFSDKLYISLPSISLLWYIIYKLVFIIKEIINLKINEEISEE